MSKASWSMADAASLAGGCILVGYLLYRRRLRKFVKVARVEKIIIYPVKSLPGIEVESAETTLAGFRRGLLRDREFMLVDAECKVVTQRFEPSLTQVQVIHEGDAVVVSTQRQQQQRPLRIPLGAGGSRDKAEKIVLYDHEHMVVDAEEECSSWFRHYLRREDIKLVRVLFDATETLDAEIGRSCPVSFQNTIGYNILSTESIDDLNRRLEEKVSCRNFKPSLLVATCSGDPYFEDYWNVVKIGDAELHFFERCNRCLDTTVDHARGICTYKEPLATLRTYRVKKSEPAKTKYKLKPLFAVQFYMGKPGMVNVGDDVFAQVSSTERL